MDFTSITPQDIIGAGVSDRDWTARADEEKRQNWHFHITAQGVHACVTYVPGDNAEEAADRALDEVVDAWYRFDTVGDGDLTRLFGNERLTFCIGPEHECDLKLHVSRMEDVQLSESSPARPVVRLLDLA